MPDRPTILRADYGNTVGPFFVHEWREIHTKAPYAKEYLSYIVVYSAIAEYTTPCVIVSFAIVINTIGTDFFNRNLNRRYSSSACCGVIYSPQLFL